MLNNEKMIEWWIKSGLKIKYTEKSLDYAITSNNEKIIKWLVSNPEYIITDIKIVKMCIELDDCDIMSNIKIYDKIVTRSIEYANELFMYNVIDAINKNSI